ncbi:MAG: hypothetical protein IJ640_13580 [Prevotella sp.]|nr:hypothetical protein [Prevotella sp.]MBR1527663.1 hypothetical protein [Prevotella sp.]
MSKKKKFSIFNDPSFKNFTEADWEEWKKNQHKIPDGTPMTICEKCVFLRTDNTCMVHDYSAHIARITQGKCDERMEE